MKQDFDFTKITTPLLLELLQEEVDSPEQFLLECKKNTSGYPDILIKTGS